MKFAKYTFWLAAIYGILVTAPLFFSEQKLGIEYPPPINHAEYFYSFAAVTLVWQILFIFVALNPARFRFIMPFCILEKLSLLPAFFIMFPQGRFPALWIPLMVVDLAFAVGFFVAFRKTRENQKEHGAA
jgi:hypothetical protein